MLSFIYWVVLPLMSIGGAVGYIFFIAIPGMILIIYDIVQKSKMKNID